MQPTTSRDFLKVALQRLTAAEAIMETLRLTLEAQYIGGYSVECSLKALIREKTPEPERPDMLHRLTHGATSHRAEVLLDRLRERGVVLTVELAKRMRRFDWTTDLRYETGRKDTGETYGLLRTARAIYEWRGANTMTTATTPPWEAKRTAETRKVEDLLRQHFHQADSYRYNSASIRIRVVDPRFEGMPREKRDAMVEPYLDMLPPETQRDIVTLFTFAPSELQQTPKTFREYMLNTEFDDPSPSML